MMVAIVRDTKGDNVGGDFHRSTSCRLCGVYLGLENQRQTFWVTTESRK